MVRLSPLPQPQIENLLGQIDNSGMEFSLIPAQSPVSELRFGLTPRYFSRRGLPTTFSFLRYAAACNSHEIEKWGPDSSNRMFILGMGYVGKFFAQDLKTRGWAVSGTCTSLVKKKKLEEMGLDVHLFEASVPEPEVLDVVKHHTHLLVSIPPLIDIGDPMLQHEELLRRRLTDGNLKWLCYLSSTSVYGNCAGDWVDEEYPVSPTDEKAKARLAAEKGWLELGHNLGISAQIFRLGGIYGPGRSAVDTLIKQKPLSDSQRMRASRHYTSRIHIADICQALRASIEKPSSGKIYSVIDDDPAPRAEVFCHALDLIARKWPGHWKQNNASFHEAQSYERSFTGKKRVSNDRMKKELGVRLLHPNYESGLRSIVEHMDNPFL